MKISYKTEGVCAKAITFELKEGKVHDIKFFGGCPGNALALSKVIEGMEAQKVVELLRGNDCGGKGTSCADQLAKAIEDQVGVIKK